MLQVLPKCIISRAHCTQHIVGFCGRRCRQFVLAPRCAQPTHLRCQFLRNLAASFHQDDARSSCELDAGPWGSFVVESRRLSSIIIIPLNAHLYPAQNKVLVNFMKGDKLVAKEDVAEKLSAKVKDNVVMITDVGNSETEHMTCHVELPLKMGKYTHIKTLCFAGNKGRLQPSITHTR